MKNINNVNNTKLGSNKFKVDRKKIKAVITSISVGGFTGITSGFFMLLSACSVHYQDPIFPASIVAAFTSLTSIPAYYQIFKEDSNEEELNDKQNQKVKKL